MNWYKRQLKIANSGQFMGRQWTDKELKKIKDLILQGISFKDIANMLGVSSFSISRLNKKYQWIPIRGKWDKELINKIGRLLKEKVHVDKISLLLGIERSTIYKLNKKYKWRDFKTEKLEQDRFVASLYLPSPDGKGLSAMEIERRYGYSLPLVQAALKRLGLIEHYRGVSESLKKLNRDNPELGRAHSKRMKQRFKDNPELGREHSEKLIQHWKDIGGLEGRLFSYHKKEDSINYLNGLFYRWKENNGMAFANFAYNKYIQIINNHTYPEDVQQQVV